MPIPWNDFVSIINSNQRFLLTSHIRPDCDALGSELGMAEILESLGKQVTIVNGQAAPPSLAFIDPRRRIKALGTEVSAGQLENIDVLMILDTSAWAQLGPMGDVIRATQARRILVDHHVGEDDLGATLFKDPTAEATGRLVVDAAGHLGVRLTPEIAMPLFAAIATDTGWFRFGSAGSVAYRAAAQLIDAGAQPAAIYRALYEQDTLARARLRGMILTHIEIELDGRLAYTHAGLDDFQQTGALHSDTEDVINSLLAIDGTQVAVIFVEQPKGGFKISFRSRCQVDCNQVAAKFGGGGHKAAAGAFVAGSLDTARTQILDAVRAAMT